MNAIPMPKRWSKEAERQNNAVTYHAKLIAFP
jgi:hypothetical protein